MKALLLFVVSFALFGCVTKQWYRNADRLIVSGVLPAEPTISAQTESDGWTRRTVTWPDEIRDPLEKVPEFEAAFRQATLFANLRTREFEGQLGYVHRYWAEKKRFLRERYEIDWKTPAELNPDINYD